MVHAILTDPRNLICKINHANFALHSRSRGEARSNLMEANNQRNERGEEGMPCAGLPRVMQDPKRAANTALRRGIRVSRPTAAHLQGNST